MLKLRLAFGLILVIAAFLYDQIRVAPKMSSAFAADPFPYLNSWERHAQAELKLSLYLLGLLNIVLAALTFHTALFPAAWIHFLLMFVGCLLYLAGLVRSLGAGPVRGWAVRRIALSAGVLAIVLSLCLDLLHYLFV